MVFCVIKNYFHSGLCTQHLDYQEKNVKVKFKSGKIKENYVENQHLKILIIVRDIRIIKKKTLKQNVNIF